MCFGKKEKPQPSAGPQNEPGSRPAGTPPQGDRPRTSSSAIREKNPIGTPATPSVNPPGSSPDKVLDPLSNSSQVTQASGSLGASGSPSGDERPATRIQDRAPRFGSPPSHQEFPDLALNSPPVSTIPASNSPQVPGNPPRPVHSATQGKYPVDTRAAPSANPLGRGLQLSPDKVPDPMPTSSQVIQASGSLGTSGSPPGHERPATRIQDHVPRYSPKPPHQEFPDPTLNPPPVSAIPASNSPQVPENPLRPAHSATRGKYPVDVPAPPSVNPLERSMQSSPHEVSYPMPSSSQVTQASGSLGASESPPGHERSATRNQEHAPTYSSPPPHQEFLDTASSLPPVSKIPASNSRQVPENPPRPAHSATQGKYPIDTQAAPSANPLGRSLQSSPDKVPGPMPTSSQVTQASGSLGASGSPPGHERPATRIQDHASRYSSQPPPHQEFPDTASSLPPVSMISAPNSRPVSENPPRPAHSTTREKDPVDALAALPVSAAESSLQPSQEQGQQADTLSRAATPDTEIFVAVMGVTGKIQNKLKTCIRWLR